jgi:hypothetical protein
MMMRLMLSTLLVGAALLFAGPTGIGQSAAYAQAGCLPNDQARTLINNGQARPFSVFLNQVQSQGKVVSSCMVPGGRYIVKVVKANGQVVQLTVGP